MGGAESKKKGEGGREKAIGGRTEEASRGGRGVEESRRGRDTKKREKMPERFGTSIRGRSHHHRETTTVQKLNKDFFAFESSFQ